MGNSLGSMVQSELNSLNQAEYKINTKALAQIEIGCIGVYKNYEFTRKTSFSEEFDKGVEKQTPQTSRELRGRYVFKGGCTIEAVSGVELKTKGNIANASGGFKYTFTKQACLMWDCQWSSEERLASQRKILEQIRQKFKGNEYKDWYLVTGVVKASNGIFVCRYSTETGGTIYVDVGVPIGTSVPLDLDAQAKIRCSKVGNGDNVFEIPKDQFITPLLILEPIIDANLELNLPAEIAVSKDNTLQQPKKKLKTAEQSISNKTILEKRELNVDRSRIESTEIDVSNAPKDKHNTLQTVIEEGLEFVEGEIDIAKALNESKALQQLIKEGLETKVFEVLRKSSDAV